MPALHTGQVEVEGLFERAMAFSLTPSWHDMNQLLWLLEQSGLFKAACRLVWDYLALFQNKRSYLRLVACDVALQLEDLLCEGWRQLHVNEPRVVLLVKEEARRFGEELSEILSFVDGDYRFVCWLPRASPTAELNHYLPCSCGPVRMSGGPTRRTVKVEYIGEGTDEIVEAW
jgi:hypothetical protein